MFAFDDHPLVETCPGTNERNEVRGVHCPPAGLGGFDQLEHHGEPPDVHEVTIIDTPTRERSLFVLPLRGQPGDHRRVAAGSRFVPAAPTEEGVPHQPLSDYYGFDHGLSRDTPVPAAESHRTSLRGGIETLVPADPGDRPVAGQGSSTLPVQPVGAPTGSRSARGAGLGPGPDT